jgi:hypothetical protein
VDNYLENPIKHHSEQYLKDMKQFYKNHLHQMTKMQNIQTTFCLNDDGEILVRLKPKIADIKMNAFTRAIT